MNSHFLKKEQVSPTALRPNKVTWKLPWLNLYETCSFFQHLFHKTLIKIWAIGRKNLSRLHRRRAKDNSRCFDCQPIYNKSLHWRFKEDGGLSIIRNDCFHWSRNTTYSEKIIGLREISKGESWSKRWQRVKTTASNNRSRHGKPVFCWFFLIWHANTRHVDRNLELSAWSIAVIVFKMAEGTISPWQWLQNKEIHVLQNVLTNRCSWSSQNTNISDEVFFFAKALCKARMPGWFGPTKKKCFFWFFFDSEPISGLGFAYHALRPTAWKETFNRMKQLLWTTGYTNSYAIQSSSNSLQFQSHQNYRGWTAMTDARIPALPGSPRTKPFSIHFLNGLPTLECKNAKKNGHESGLQNH